ncbi:MAG: hypothetical protein AAGH74_10680 [Pseudomonadota bacterium]
MNAQETLRLVYRRGRLKAGSSFFVSAWLFIAILAWEFLGVPTLAYGAGVSSEHFELILDLALPITGLLMLWGGYEFWGAVSNRDPNVIGDQSGLTLVANDDVIGPFTWREILRVSVKNLPGRRRVLAISLRNPEMSMERFPSSINRYRKFLAHEGDLILPPSLFDAPLEQVAKDLDEMRALFAPHVRY